MAVKPILKRLERLLRLGKPKSRPGLKYLFTQAGHDFYTFDKIEIASARRYLAFIRLTREHELGVSREDLETFLDLTIQANNQGNTSRVGALCHTLKAYTDLYTDNRRIFEVANCFVLVDDEPINDFSDSHSILKKAMFDASESVRFFFIKTSISYIKSITELPEDFKIEDYLKSQNVELTEQAWYKLTSRSS